MDFLKKIFGDKEVPKVEKEKPKAEKKPEPKKKSAKDIATEKGEPYIAVVGVELDPENLGNGAFELDWNDKFVTNLVRQGYQLRPNEDDATIVDRWFQEVCKNIALENFEQWEANQPFEARPRVMDKKDLGNGKSEIG